MNNDAIVVSDLWKTFRLPHEKKSTLYESIIGMFENNGHEDFVALKNINFSVKKGEAVGIIGENGSGKSTLLKIITNILRADKGTVEINGKITSFLELGVGFQQDLTVKENVYLYGAVMGMSDGDIDGKIEEMLDFSGLKRFEDAKLKNLSSGMQVRIAFATAVQTNPEILLMDEVLAVGDMEFQQKCIDVFQRYIKDKKTIIFVSHDLGSVRKFCSKTLLLRHGEQIAFGSTNEIIDKYVYNIGDVEKKTDENLPEQKIEEKGKVEDKITRWGNKKVEITSVKFCDKFGNESGNFMTGDSMEIKIKYKVNTSVDNLVIGIAIYSDSNIFCYGTNTDIMSYLPDSSLGDQEIKLLIRDLIMMEGKFYLTFAAHNKEHVAYDWIDKEFSFNIVKRGNDAGMCSIPCEWI